MTPLLVRTALYDAHERWGGNIVDFHGFELPIWYSSMMEEHLNTRENAGLFDVSHMGFFRFSGGGVREWLQTLATQRIEHLEVGRCAYTHFLDSDGFIIDDMIFAVNSEIEVFGVPNAYMAGNMLQWFTDHSPSDGSISITDLSEETSILAIQGPNSMSLVRRILGESNFGDKFYYYVFIEKILGTYPESAAFVRPTWEFAGSLTVQDFILLGLSGLFLFLTFIKLELRGFKLFSKGEAIENASEGTEEVFKSSKILIFAILIMYIVQ